MRGLLPFQLRSQGRNTGKFSSRTFCRVLNRVNLGRERDCAWTMDHTITSSEPSSSEGRLPEKKARLCLQKEPSFAADALCLHAMYE